MRYEISKPGHPVTPQLDLTGQWHLFSYTQHHYPTLPCEVQWPRSAEQITIRKTNSKRKCKFKKLNKCLYDAIQDLKMEGKKSLAKAGLNPGRSRLKKTEWLCSWFGSSCQSWLTDVSSSQRWVIYSQTNGAVSNYTYLFRFVWFVVVFSDFLFCFQTCYFVFEFVIVFSDLL